MIYIPGDEFIWSKELLDNEDKKMEKLKEVFLSPRFWGIVATSASIVTTSPDFTVDVWYVSLVKFVGLVVAGATAIRSWDRSADKALEGAKLQAGQSVSKSKIDN